MLNCHLSNDPALRRLAALASVLLVTIALPAAAVRARQTALPLAGSVYDVSGAVLPQVNLTLQDTQARTWHATTDSAGRFAFAAVPAGRYTLQASLAGFRSLGEAFELQNARDWDRAITMQVGEIQETVTVQDTRIAGGPPASGPGPGPVRIGGNIRAPRKLHHVPPTYPASMRMAGREGAVPIQAIIGLDGTVIWTRVLGAHVHPDFAAAATEAVRQWRFDATLLNGVPVEVVMNVSVKFSLSE
jgi:TonB family protein